MEARGVGAVRPLAERRDVAKTSWRKGVLWQTGGERRELAAVAAMGPAERRGMTGSGARCVEARLRVGGHRVRGTWLQRHASASRRKSREIVAATYGK